jgi:hypothetical protein
MLQFDWGKCILIVVARALHHPPLLKTNKYSYSPLVLHLGSITHVVHDHSVPYYQTNCMGYHAWVHHHTCTVPSVHTVAAKVGYKRECTGNKCGSKQANMQVSDCMDKDSVGHKQVHSNSIYLYRQRLCRSTGGS